MDWKAGLDNAFSDVLSRRNLLLLVLFWAAGLFLLVSYGTCLGRLHEGGVRTTVVQPTAGENETGAFSTWCPEATGLSRSSYRVAFDNLAAQDRSLGVFRTASHKQVHIENLHVTFHTAATATPQAGIGFRLRDFCDLFTPRSAAGTGTSQLAVFDELVGSDADWSVRIDLSNATEVRIRDLDWRVCRAGVTVLRVQCRLASLRGDGSRVVLRGHATVTTPGAVLESNCIEMDVRDERFVVNGRYLLTRGGRREGGDRGQFDVTLRMLGVESSDTGEYEAWADGSQHGPF
ncbi:MAG: hypothetical protein JSW27_25530 [Phycisphaerales bacterium]|nr:MAG: hypothetical protein JSW27_25530 [Phycisphaerales bacterium]